MVALAALVLAAVPSIVPSRVTVSMHDTIARFVVHADIQVEAGPSEGSQVLLDLPAHAMIFAGTVRVGGHVEPLRLTRTSTVDAQFVEIYSAPKSSARPWALRIDRSDDTATFEVDAPRDATLALELTMDAPTCFFGDNRYVHVAEGWADRLPSLRPTVAREDIDNACEQLDGGSWIALRTREVSAQPGGERRVGVVASQLSLADRRFARVELALASKLMPAPKDLHTAIVVDHSRSMTQDDLENAQAIIDAYLAEVPGTRVQVIAFSRTTQPLLSGWTVASRASAPIARALRSLPPSNGSDIDTALSAAAAWLEHAPGTRRLLLLTDERLATRISDHADALAKLVPAGTLAHVVVVTGSSGQAERDDLATLAPFATQTGGIAASAGLGEDGRLDVRLLVEPQTLDHVRLSGPGWTESVSEANACTVEDGTIEAGRSCTWWAQGTRGAGALTLTGQLWGRTITRTFVPDARRAVAVARILSAFGTFAPDIQREIELAAHAVNGAWSLFAVWGGTGGYAETELTSDIIGGLSLRGIGTSSIDTITDTLGVATSIVPELTRQLRGAVASCSPPSGVVARVEMTLDEIVDVEVITPDLGPAEACVREAIWDTAVSLPRPPEHANATLLFHRS